MDQTSLQMSYYNIFHIEAIPVLQVFSEIIQPGFELPQVPAPNRWRRGLSAPMRASCQWGVSPCHGKAMDP